MNFNTWLDTFLDEKGIDRDRMFQVEGSWGPNFIPLETVVEHMKIAPKHEKDALQNMLVKIDFNNGDVYHYLYHLAGALAI